MRNEFSYTICWQTPNGVTEKLGPNICYTLKNIKNNGFSQVLLVPLIFSMDLLERMFINEIEMAEPFAKKVIIIMIIIALFFISFKINNQYLYIIIYRLE